MKPARIKRHVDLLLIAAFAVMLAFPTVYSLSGFSQGRLIDEYRVLAEFPGFNSDAGLLQEFGHDIEKYYDDHFGGRDLLIAAHLRIERFLFPEMAGGIITGHDGWLYSLDQNMLNNFLAATNLTIRQLQSRQAELEERRDKLAALGIKYIFVISPNKESIYPQYLPGWLQRSAPARTATDQFVEYMHTHSTVQLLDLRPAMREASAETPLFYKTDTHWNLMGAYVACETIVSNLSNQLPPLTPVPLTNFVVQQTNGIGGDIARFAGMLTMPDKNFYTFTPKAQLPVQNYYGGTNLIDFSRFGTLPVLEFPAITMTNSHAIHRAVIFGDSYTFALAPFLGYHFDEVNVFRGNFDLDLVAKIKPDIVIDEKVERWLHASFHRG